MKCINKISFLISCILIPALVLTACGSPNYTMAYDRNRNNSSFTISSVDNNADVLDAFASTLCVTADDVTAGTSANMSDVTAAGLFDLNDTNVIYAKNIHEKLNPASLTKVMTALLALKYGNLEDTLTASSNVKINESGAVVLGLEPGDTLTLNQALHALLLKSANDVAILIAEYIGGSVEGFADMMNEEAAKIGATNCHFVNPHGLTDPEHYVTAYDLYLIFQEVSKYDKFVEIIQTPSYQSVYHNAQGAEKTIDLKTSNLYLRNEVKQPENLTVIGGKTGTTAAAGSCLILYSKDSSGNAYISVILKAVDRGILYEEMTELLNEV